MAEQTVDPKIVERVQKLLALAGNNPNEKEASAALQKAQEYAEQYNIDVTALERAGGTQGTREKQMLAGGMYQYQRDLWYAVAKLNFCVYQYRRVRQQRPNGRSFRQYQHLVIGRTINVRNTESMCRYLEQTAERLCRERLHERGETSQQFYSSWAVAFREGLVARVIEKVRERRNERKWEEHARAAKAARAGTSTATALTVADVEQSEKEANDDFMYGAGFTARAAERRARQAAADAKAEAEYARWAAAHPEEVAQAAEEERKRAARAEKQRARRSYSYRERAPTAAERRQDSGGYWSGYDAGKGVGIDPQMQQKAGGLLR